MIPLASSSRANSELLAARTVPVSFRVPRVLYYSALIPLSATAFRPLMGLTLSDWLFFASLTVLLIELPASRGQGLRGLPLVLTFGVAIFALGGTISSLNASFPLQSFAVLVRFVYLTVVWFWLGIMVLRTLSHVVVALSLWTLSAAIAGALAIAQAVWGYAILPASMTGPAFYGREAGWTLHPNDLGTITSCAMVPCLVLLMRSRGHVPQLAYLTALVALVGGLVVSGSVGGFVAAMFGFAAWVAAFPGARRPLLLGSVVVIAAVWLAIGPYLSLPFASPAERVLQVTANTSTASLQSRLAFDSKTIDLMMNQPIIGYGLDDASQRQVVIAPPENMFLLAWLGSGLFGLLGIIAIVLACIREGIRKLRILGRPRPWDICAALFISFLATLVFTLASPVLQQRYAWIAVALMLAIRVPRVPKVYPISSIDLRGQYGE